MNHTISEKGFTFDDLKQVKREKLGTQVPLELFRAIRLIGMHDALPLNGKATTVTIGRAIGEKLPVASIEQLFDLFKGLKIGIPSIVTKDQNHIRVAVEDCFCEGLPVQEGKMVCDLEGAIFEGALANILGKRVTVKEVKCNVNGDHHCEYDVRVFQ